MGTAAYPDRTSRIPGTHHTRSIAHTPVHSIASTTTHRMAFCILLIWTVGGRVCKGIKGGREAGGRRAQTELCVGHNERELLPSRHSSRERSWGGPFVPTLTRVCVLGVCRKVGSDKATGRWGWPCTRCTLCPLRAFKLVRFDASASLGQPKAGEARLQRPFSAICDFLAPPDPLPA